MQNRKRDTDVRFTLKLQLLRGLPRWLSVKESARQCRRCRKLGFDPLVRKIPWRRKWQSTPVFLSGKSHGQRSLAGHSSRGWKELDTTEWLSTHAELSWQHDTGEGVTHRSVKKNRAFRNRPIQIQWIDF